MEPDTLDRILIFSRHFALFLTIYSTSCEPTEQTAYSASSNSVYNTMVLGEDVRGFPAMSLGTERTITVTLSQLGFDLTRRSDSLAVWRVELEMH